MEKIDYCKLAREQFLKLKEDMLDEDRHCVGADGEEDYNIEGIKFRIKISGFWEKSNWFDWYAYDDNGVLIEKGYKDLW